MNKPSSAFTSVVAFGALVIAVLAPTSALDVGVELSNETTLGAEGEVVTLTQENQAKAWITMPIGSFSSLYASGVYSFEGDFELSPETSQAIVPYTFNAGRIEWEGFLPLDERSSFAWSIGRIAFADHSGRALSGLFDGAALDYSFGSVQIRAQAAYTGLSLKGDANILVDDDDIAIFNSGSDTWVELFAPARLIASVRALTVELAPRHDIGLEAWAQFDLEPGTVTNTQYFEPFVEGRVGRSWRWRLWGIAELGQQDGEAFYSIAGGGSARFSMPELLGLRTGLSAAWAGGDYDGDGGMRAFVPITSAAIATISGVTFTDALTVSLDASVTPISGLASSFNATALLKPGATGSDLYRGAEMSVRLAYKPWTDVSTTVVGGYFFPNTSATEPDDSAWSVALQAKLEL